MTSPGYVLWVALTVTLAVLFMQWLTDVVGIHWWWVPFMTGHYAGGLGRLMYVWMWR